MNRETRTKVAENERGYLGIRGEDVSQDISQMYNMPTGVYIAESIKGGGADRAGITKGSVITALNGISVTGMESLQEQLQYYKIGEKVTVTVQVPGNDGEYKSQDVDVVLVSSSN